MHFLTDFGIAILTSYLAFTNMLASELGAVIYSDEGTVIETRLATEPELRRLESRFSDRFAIPDVLLQNAAFQGASALSSNNPATTSSYSPEEAMVNIYCTYTTDTTIQATTGSGFFISREGAVLTNAHVAQFLLLEDAQRDGETVCILRSGNPAEPAYEAELLYIPPAWVVENATLLNEAAPRGTGERDYALLYASKRVTKEPLPIVFPHLRVNTTEMQRRDEGQAVAAYGYPATPLHEEGLEADLALVSATSTLGELYTFARTTADLMSVPTDSVNRGGASGGPVVDAAGTAIGVIVTRGLDSENIIRALTLPYINRTLTEETGFDLATYASGDLAFKATVFNQALAPLLTTILERQFAE